jgi:hypothetical protein
LAKKRRQKIEKKEDYVYTPPEIDKHQFIRDELRNAKATFVAFGLAILMGLVSFGLLIAIGDFRVGAIIGIFGVAALPFIYGKIKLDISGFEWKNWAGVIAVYIFSWLMIAVLLVNPPLTDLASPEIKDVVIEELIIDKDGNENWTKALVNTDGETTINLDAQFRILVTILDNDELDVNSINLEFDSTIETNGTVELRELEKHRYSFEARFSQPTAQTGDYKYEITAKDTNGNKEVKSGSITLVQPTN